MPSTTIYSVLISVEATEHNDTYVYLKEYNSLPPDIDRFGSNELYKSIYISEDRNEAFGEYLKICNFDAILGRLVNKVPTRLVAAIETLRKYNDGIDFSSTLCGNSTFPQDKTKAETAYATNHGMFPPPTGIAFTTLVVHQ